MFCLKLLTLSNVEHYYKNLSCPSVDKNESNVSPEYKHLCFEHVSENLSIKQSIEIAEKEGCPRCYVAAAFVIWIL